MHRTLFLFFKMICFSVCFWTVSAFAHNHMSIPILTYHNFDPSIPGSMTISTGKFEEQLKWLKANGYTVIPLRELVSYLQGKRSSLPRKSVVITADDGRKSVYTYMLPIIRKYKVPVTLFVYPSTISKTSYALTWEQLKELQKTGLIDIQSHTYWHPNFKQEKKNLSHEAYNQFVHSQLIKAKKILEEKLHTEVDFLAWPYGIYDNQLRHEAAKAGYTMAFSIDDRHACPAEQEMSQPRYMIREEHSMKTFATIVNGVRRK